MPAIIIKAINTGQVRWKKPKTMVPIKTTVSKIIEATEAHIPAKTATIDNKKVTKTPSRPNSL